MESEKRKQWIKKYRKDISPDGFVANCCSPEHVYKESSARIGDTSDEVGISYYVGFDGTRKTYEELTEEEKQDLKEQLEEWEKNLPDIVEKFHRTVERHRDHNKER